MLQLTATMRLLARLIMLTKPKHSALQRQNPDTTHQAVIYLVLLAIPVAQNLTILTVLVHDLVLAVLTITMLVVLTITASTLS